MFLYDLFLLLISSLILLIVVLVGVAFLTLLERKVLGYIQLRKGPNKLGVMGIMQPFSDAIKLFTKESINPMMSNYYIYYLCPIFNLFISLMMWLSIPMVTMFYNFNYSMLFFFCCSSLGVYTLMVAGWSSNSNYSMLGSIRSVVQTISYEVSLLLIILSFLIIVLGLNIIDLMKYQFYMWLMFMMFPLSMILIVSFLAETNRTPFDFAEGESELVSGFNIEYSSGGFALIFLAEYSSILFMSFISIMLFMGGDLYSFIFFMKLVFLSFFWIWVRGTMPRFRYDKLMNLAWKSFLPVSLNFLFFYMGLKSLILVLFI
uniref:NADH-ubiquinone oxidoreductase chain 1 n=1 Tax=Tyraphus nitidus TaxID=2973947 RepID=A0A976UF23_9COLE|nr:NADH dehydrogenase subunit 1 [Tyraphus nitidus]UVG40776.1 NADH dehydrogenase subunit 1 [Tyraphus nitidus]